MEGVTILDLAVIFVYLFGMLYIGLRYYKRVKNAEDFYTANRSFSGRVLLATVCATIIGGSTMLGRAGMSYSNGIEAMITALPYITGMFLLSFCAGRIHDIGIKRNISSIPALFGYRFGRAARLVIAFMIVFVTMGTVASQITATATIIKVLGSGTGISYELGALIATLVFIVYTAASGLFGVVYTDVLQFFILITFVYIMLPIASIHTIGGLDKFLANLDTSYLVPKVDGKIVGDILTYLVFTMGGSEMWQRAFAAKSRKDARRGMFWGTAIYSVSIWVILLLGLAAQQIFPNIVADWGSTDAVIPALTVLTLPPGFTGLALAGVMSVMMSSADSYLLVSAQTAVGDIGKVLKPDLDKKRELLLSRVMTVFLALGALTIALYIHNAYVLLTALWAYYAAAAGIPAMAALYWEKATAEGVISAMIGGFTVCAIWKALGSPFGIGATVPGAAACVALLVIVSLATYKKHPCPMA